MVLQANVCMRGLVFCCTFMKSGSTSRTFCRLKALMFKTASRSTWPMVVSTVLAAPLILCRFHSVRQGIERIMHVMLRSTALHFGDPEQVSCCCLNTHLPSYYNTVIQQYITLILCSREAFSSSVTRSVLLITTTSANASCSTDCAEARSVCRGGVKTLLI